MFRDSFGTLKTGTIDESANINFRKRQICLRQAAGARWMHEPCVRPTSLGNEGCIQVGANHASYLSFSFCFLLFVSAHVFCDQSRVYFLDEIFCF
jgi:hypothetical protein